VTTETIDTPGSSHIIQVAYDDESREMEVAFADGQLYVYFGVPKEVFQGFKSAGSAGSYFHRQVRNRYRYRPK